jgi:hypothetical protein
MSHDECSNFNKQGNILISDQFNNRVIETTSRGDIIWSYGLGPTNLTCAGILGVRDAQRFRHYTLMAGAGIPAGLIPEANLGAVDNRVIAVDKIGNIVWQYGQFGQSGSSFNLLNIPVQCTFIPLTCPQKKHHKKIDPYKYFNLNGYILITDQGNDRVIMVNKKKEIIWQYANLNEPNSAEYLVNGNILIADGLNNRAIEVNSVGVIIAIFNAGGTLGKCAFASRLPNGNTLLTDATNSRVVEVNVNDVIVWQYITNMNISVPLPNPSRGLRLSNGDTLISDQYNNRVIQVNSTNIITAFYGLPPVNDLTTIGSNKGYAIGTTQLGLYCPADAKIIGDYTGITNAYI